MTEPREAHPDPYDTMPPEPPAGFTPTAYGEWDGDYETGRAYSPDPGEAEPNDPLTELTPPKNEAGSRIFVNRDSGTMIRILNEDDSYVRYAALDGTARTSMPRADYDKHFGSIFRPATAADLAGAFTSETDKPITPPKNVPEDWK